MVQKRYSDILAEILEKKKTANDPSKCTCPVEYFNPIQTKKPGQGCCQFGPDCQFLSCDNPQPVACQYDQARSTCYAQCICGPQPEPPVQLLHSPQLCICGPSCLCESEDTLTARPTCDKTRCVCDVCLCQPDISNSKLLPAHFRNAIKKDRQITDDERIKQECAEIKQLLVEHEESKKKELEETAIAANEKINKKGPRVSIVSDHVGPPPPDNKDDPSVKESLNLQDGAKSPELTTKSLKESFKSHKSTRKSSKKVKSQKPKMKQIKPAPIQSKATTPSAFTQYSCGCRMPKKKTLHMRYYYSGGTEHYGVKLGHKRCMPKVSQVPRHMGWLWNIEDPSKGIRERKGWPPGFIAKNIKNMMKVLKQLESGDQMVTASKPYSEMGARKFRRRVAGDVETEPQEEPPLLHIHKKGRTYNITFCPKSSDTDIGPIPIPFSITEKRRDSDSSSSDSTLEFEFHSPKPKRPPLPAYLLDPEDRQPEEAAAPSSATETTAPPPTAKTPKKKPNKKRSLKSTEENKNLWEEQQTQIENIA